MLDQAIAKRRARAYLMPLRISHQRPIRRAALRKLMPYILRAIKAIFRRQAIIWLCPTQQAVAWLLRSLLGERYWLLVGVALNFPSRT